MNSRLVLLGYIISAICSLGVNGDVSLEQRVIALEAQLQSSSLVIQDLRHRVSFLNTEVGDLKHEDDVNKRRISALESKDQQSLYELNELKIKIENQNIQIENLKNSDAYQAHQLHLAYVEINYLKYKVEELESKCLIGCTSATPEPTTTTTRAPTTTTTVLPITIPPLPIDTTTDILVETAHLGPIDWLVTTDDEKYLVTRSKQSDVIKIWNLEQNGVLVKELRQTDGLAAGGPIQIISSGRLVAGNGQGDLHVFDSNFILAKVKKISNHVISSIVSYGTNSVILGVYQSIIFVDLDTDQLNTISNAHKHAVDLLVLESNKSLITASNGDTDIKVWSLLGRLSLSSILKGHSLGVKSLLIDPNTGYLISGSLDKTIRVWRIDSQSEIKQLSGGLSGIDSLAIRRTDNSLISLTELPEASLKVWNLDKSEYTELNYRGTTWRKMSITKRNKLLASTWPNGFVVKSMRSL